MSSTARAVAAPAPVAADRHRDRLVPGPSSPRATEAPERSETSCSEERPPERTATLMALLLRRRRRRRPCRRRSSPCRPVRARSPPAGTGRPTRPTLPGASVSSSSTVGLRPAARIASTASARSLPTTFGTLACFLPEETTIETVEPASTWLPALGDWPITSPAGELLSSSETLGVRPRPRICCTATAALAADQHRHLGQLRAAGDEQGDCRSRASRSCRPTVRSGSPAPLRPSRS